MFRTSRIGRRKRLRHGSGGTAGDVAVGKEGLSFFVVILHAGLFDEFSLIVQLAEEVGSRVVMRL